MQGVLEPGEKRHLESEKKEKEEKGRKVKNEGKNYGERLADRQTEGGEGQKQNRKGFYWVVGEE